MDLKRFASLSAISVISAFLSTFTSVYGGDQCFTVASSLGLCGLHSLQVANMVAKAWETRSHAVMSRSSLIPGLPFPGLISRLPFPGSHSQVPIPRFPFPGSHFQALIPRSNSQVPIPRLSPGNEARRGGERRDKEILDLGSDGWDSKLRLSIHEKLNTNNWSLLTTNLRLEEIPPMVLLCASFPGLPCFYLPFAFTRNT